MTRLLAACLLASTFLALAACNGDDDTSGPPLPSGRTAAPRAGGDASQASKLAATFLAGVDGKYVYRYTGPIGDVKEGVLTVYRLGVNDRQDWTTDTFGFDASTVTIMAAETNYICTVSGALNNCRITGVPEIDGLRVISSPIYGALAALVTDADKFKFEDLPDETIGGVSSKCYRAASETRIGEGPPSSEEIKACYTDEGAVIYFERTTTPDSTAIEASTFAIELQETTEAVPADFEPPGRVQ